jgi:hypothetical protein
MKKSVDNKWSCLKMSKMFLDGWMENRSKDCEQQSKTILALKTHVNFVVN